MCVCVCMQVNLYMSVLLVMQESKRQRTQSSGATPSCARRANAAKRLEARGEGPGVQLAWCSIPLTWEGVRGEWRRRRSGRTLSGLPHCSHSGSVSPGHCLQAAAGLQGPRLGVGLIGIAQQFPALLPKTDSWPHAFP